MKRFLIALAMLMTASACGVQPTPVVPAGPAPTLGRSGHGSQLILYYLVDGRVQPVIRPAIGTVSPSRALAFLLAGPTADESNRGLGTLLPSPDTGSASVSVSSQDVVIVVPFAVKALPSLALDQLVCTTTAALALSDSPLTATFTVAGPDLKLAGRSCQVR